MNGGKMKYLGKSYNPDIQSMLETKYILYSWERRKSAIMLKMSVKTNLLISHYKKLSRLGLFTNKDKENMRPCP